MRVEKGSSSWQLLFWGLLGCLNLFVCTGRLSAQVLDQQWSVPMKWVHVGVADVNGDGYDDVVLTGQDTTTDDYELRVYRGSAQGVAASPAFLKSLPRTKSGRVSGLGDVDGDGFEDVAIGNPPRVYVYRGSASGLSSEPSWTKEKGTGFGFAVEAAGDVNGDGYDDLIVGEPWATQSGCPFAVNDQPGPTSRVHVYHGSSSGLSASADWTKVHENDETMSCLGYGVDGDGDVDGDGYDDVVVGAWTHVNPNQGNGKAFVYQGSSSGLSETADWETGPPGTIPGTAGSFAHHPRMVGDVDGDGYDDVAMTAFDADFQEGQGTRFFLFRGSGAGVESSASWVKPDYSGLVGGGDVDGDGFADLYLLGPLPGRSHSMELFQGSRGGMVDVGSWRASGYVDLIHSTIEGDVDLDGDGFSDMVVYQDFVHSPKQSKVRAYFGGPNPEPTASAMTVTVRKDGEKTIDLEASDPAGDPLTFSIERSVGHGQLNEMDRENGEATYVPQSGYTGEDSFEFRVEDPYGGADTATVDIEVQPPNRPPEFVEPTPEDGARLTATVGRPFSFEVKADDPDGDELSYEVTPLPGDASFDEETREFQWTPQPDGVVLAQPTLSASDGRATALRQISVRVAERRTDSGIAGDADTGECPDCGGGEVGTNDTEDDLEVDATLDASGNDRRDDRAVGCGCTASSGRRADVWGLLLVVVGVLVARIRRRSRR